MKTNDTHRVLEIHTGNIELYKVLKVEGLSDSGGLAKMLIADGPSAGKWAGGNPQTKKDKTR